MDNQVTSTQGRFFLWVDLRRILTAVTVANGGDNVAVYTPVLRTSSAGDITVTIGVFAAGVALWCALGTWLVSHRNVSDVLGRWRHWMVPAVFILIGLSVFCKAGFGEVGWWSAW